jgi:hypothetical protein
MQVVVRDRSAELLDGPPVLRALTISAFCWRCCVRRGPATTLTDYHLNCTYQVSHWEHPCGHVDSNEDTITEAELSCAAVECVLICRTPTIRTARLNAASRGLKLADLVGANGSPALG